MTCPDCGYVLGPFETACPRCARVMPPTGAAGAYRCPFCHAWVPERDRPAHARTHAGTRPDGQQTEYVTLPPEARFQQSLEGVPCVYFHARCGGQTGMPEEIIRSYLQNPYLYYSDRSFCTGCRTHVPCRALTWAETGENMQAYNDRLRAARPDLRPWNWGLLRFLAQFG